MKGDLSKDLSATFALPHANYRGTGQALGNDSVVVCVCVCVYFFVAELLCRSSFVHMGRPLSRLVLENDA